MVNDNWQKLKSCKKHRLGVNFMCEKIFTDGMHKPHDNVAAPCPGILKNSWLHYV